MCEWFFFIFFIVVRSFFALVAAIFARFFSLHFSFVVLLMFDVVVRCRFVAAFFYSLSYSFLVHSQVFSLSVGCLLCIFFTCNTSTVCVYVQH